MITSREKDVDYKNFSVCTLEMLGEMHGHSNRYDAMAEAKTLSKYKKLTNNTLFVYLACKNEL